MSNYYKQFQVNCSSKCERQDNNNLEDDIGIGLRYLRVHRIP